MERLECLACPLKDNKPAIRKSVYSLWHVVFAEYNYGPWMSLWHFKGNNAMTSAARNWTPCTLVSFLPLDLPDTTLPPDPEVSLLLFFFLSFFFFLLTLVLFALHFPSVEIISQGYFKNVQRNCCCDYTHLRTLIRIMLIFYHHLIYYHRIRDIFAFLFTVSWALFKTCLFRWD